MAVTFFPFNSIVVDGVPDRPANAENLAAYLAGFFSNGVLMQEDTALKVEAYSGMEVQIHAGMGNINGKTIFANAAEIITLDTASASQDRIDRVVFRLDEANRLMEFDVLTGTPAASPTAPALTQAADVYEMCLAEIRVPAGASEILASHITDTRADESLCGISSTIDGEITLKSYPIGAVYISYEPTSPAELFGGTWTPITGVFPYFNAGTGTGGSNTHTLTIAEMPSHSHSATFETTADKLGGGSTYARFNNNGTPTDGIVNIGNTGGGQAHNNMPAYQTFYAWRRIA